MNILPKKSWHVRNKDNVARVRRDEAQAEEEGRERRRRADLAEQEARTGFLRKKARHSLPDCASHAVQLAEPKAGPTHINFFEELQDGKGSKKGNKEYEEEKRAEKERQEKAIGLLTYLGQSAAEAQTSRPWYQEAPEHRKKEAADTAKDEKLKGRLDPLHEMEKYLRKKRGDKSHKKSHKESKDRGKEKRPEEKKEIGSTKPSIEQLRQERLRREKAERARAEALLAGSRGEKPPMPAEQELDDRKRRYNSQFNPTLARKPKIHEDYR